jgi:hypothetical protein
LKSLPGSRRSRSMVWWSNPVTAARCSRVQPEARARLISWRRLSRQLVALSVAFQTLSNCVS